MTISACESIAHASFSHCTLASVSFEEPDVTSYRPLILPRFGRVTEFLRPHFRITSGWNLAGVIAWWLESKCRVRPLLSTDKRARQLLWCSVEGTGEILYPRGETLPGNGSPDWTPHLLDHNQEHAGPERGALNLPVDHKS